MTLIIVLNAARSQTSLWQRNATLNLLSLLGLKSSKIILLILRTTIWLHLHNILVYSLWIYQDVFLTVLRIRLLWSLLKILLVSFIHTLKHLARTTFLGLQTVRSATWGKISLGLSLLANLLILEKSLLLCVTTLGFRRWSLWIGNLFLLLGGAVAVLHL